MRPSSQIILAIAVVLGAILVMRGIVLNRPSDQVQIQQQIASAVNSANNHNSAGIVSLLSSDYHDDNNFNPDVLRSVLITAFRDNPSFKVGMSPVKITVNGNAAQSEFYVHIDYDNGGSHSGVDHKVRLSWEKQPSHMFLIFPSTTWLVSSASYGQTQEFDVD